MKLLVDGVIFQFSSNRFCVGIERIWSSILPRLASYSDLDIVLLDRGNCPSIQGIERIEFPSYTWTNSAADSILVDKLCLEVGADIFSSTYYTTPLGIPSILFIYDMIPENLGFDLSQRRWQEKQIAISFGSYYSCVSECVRSDLLRIYPSIGGDRSIVTYCGVESDTFNPRERHDVEAFKRKWGCTRPYYLVVGSCERQLNDQNVSLLCRAVRYLRDLELEVLCLGGETKIGQDLLDELPPSISARSVDLTDEELACAYSGAEALVYPPLYEGFGMPVVEAMACGCPVIATSLGSPGEVAGDAAMFISGWDEDELREAMLALRQPSCRKLRIESGLRRAAIYDWDITARGFYDLLKRAMVETKDPAMQEFFREWKRHRIMQADVDVW